MMISKIRGYEKALKREASVYVQIITRKYRHWRLLRKRIKNNQEITLLLLTDLSGISPDSVKDMEQDFSLFFQREVKLKYRIVTRFGSLRCIFRVRIFRLSPPYREGESK